MEPDKVIHADPLVTEHGRKRKFPNDLIFVCAYYLNIGPDTIVEAALFHRSRNQDEIWVVAGCDLALIMEVVAEASSRAYAIRHTSLLGWGCALVVRKQGEESRACADLLRLLFLLRVGHYWPEGFLSAGIIDEDNYCRVKGQVEQELDENERKALETETEIVEVARQLGLCPRPTGKDPEYWLARCPKKNHPLFIRATDNIFYCGYCRRKGSMDELRSLVKERQEP